MKRITLAVVLVLASCGTVSPLEVGPSSSTSGTAGGQITECRKGAVPECTSRTWVYPE